MVYELPFRAEEFDNDEFVCWMRDKHSAGGVQEHGYDLGAMTWQDGAWREFSGDGTANEDWHLFGKPIHAMQAGTVIAGWRNAPLNPVGSQHAEIANGRIYGGGNGMWIQHDDGTLCEYAHMFPGSVPSELVPHDDELLPNPASSPDVTACWDQIYIPVAQQVRVEVGQFLGHVGNVGTSSNPHLHVHCETGASVTATSKSGGNPVVMTFARGLASTLQEHPQWSSFSGQEIPHGPDGRLIWPPETLSREVGRHGVDIDRYQDMFMHIGNSGFQLDWLDTYSIGGHVFTNQVWHPATDAWGAHHLLALPDHLAAIDAAAGNQHHPVLLESCLSGDQVRYSAVFHRLPDEGPQLVAHDVDLDTHEAMVDQAHAQGFFPASISVVSVGGERRYTLLYRPGDIGSWSIKSRIAEADYQAEYDRQAGNGRYPVYLAGYVHEGTTFLSIVFASTDHPTSIARHGMSAAEYQDQWKAATDSGLITGTVTAFDGAADHRFAARWWG